MAPQEGQQGDRFQGQHSDAYGRHWIFWSVRIVGPIKKSKNISQTKCVTCHLSPKGKSTNSSHAISTTLHSRMVHQDREKTQHTRDTDSLGVWGILHRYYEILPCWQFSPLLGIFWHFLAFFVNFLAFFVKTKKICVTCHKSHVTCHMSHVMCHMSPSTCHYRQQPQTFPCWLTHYPQ